MAPGSAPLITEFFSYAINNLLQIRDVCPPESFSRVSKYGLTMPITTDKAIADYMDAVLVQMNTWLTRGCLQRVVVIIAAVATGKVLERWSFDVSMTAMGENDASSEISGISEEEEKKVIGEVQAVMRQVTASASFLPLMEEPCSFDVLMYIDKNEETPTSWEGSSSKVIGGRENVQLRSFSAPGCTVKASVSYGKPCS